MKLVMTLLVRDEADIIRENILYHLNRGVDFIVATDNLSVDGTLDVLMDFQSRGLLYVIRETDDNYAQARWVTRMARLACTEFAADWVINSDADEFWWPPAGNLKDMLASVPPEIGSIAAWRGDFLPRPESEGSVFERMIYRETRSTNSLGQPLPPKVMHRAMADVEVGQGNHFLVAPRGVNTAGVQGLEHAGFEVERRFLRQVADAHPAPDRHAAGVGRLQAGHDAQQRRLAAAVDPDQADAVAAVDAQIDGVQQHPLGVLHVDALERDQVHGRSRPDRWARDFAAARGQVPDTTLRDSMRALRMGCRSVRRDGARV